MTAAGMMDVTAWLVLAAAFPGTADRPGRPWPVTLVLISGFVTIMLLVVAGTALVDQPTGFCAVDSVAAGLDAHARQCVGDRITRPASRVRRPWLASRSRLRTGFPMLRSLAPWKRRAACSCRFSSSSLACP